MGEPNLGEVYAAHWPGLLRLAVLLVDDRETAEDVVQDAFAGLVHRGVRGWEPDAVLAYLRVSVVNRARSALRRRRTARGHTPPIGAAPSRPDELALLGEEHREVIAALAALGQRQREVLVLRYWGELSEAEIAAATGISRGAVKSTASRAVAALERALTREEASR